MNQVCTLDKNKQNNKADFLSAIELLAIGIFTFVLQSLLKTSYDIVFRSIHLHYLEIQLAKDLFETKLKKVWPF